LQGDVLQQPPLGWCERFARRTGRDQQLADCLGLIDQRQLYGIISGLTMGRRDLLVVALPEHQGDIGQLEKVFKNYAGL
jgi:hypothetical protein